MVGAALATAATLIFGGGLRVDQPSDDTPTLFGVDLDLRYAVFEGAHVGLRAAWGGGVNDNNPERLLITQRTEVVAVLGGRLPLTETVDLLAEATGGVFRADGWPRGALPNLHQWSVQVGGDVGATAWLMRAWGHPMGLELRAGAAYTRLNQQDIYLPFVGLSLVGVLDEPTLPEATTPSIP